MRWIRGTVGGLPSQFWALWTATLVNRAGGFVIVFLAIYLTGQRHFSPSLAGLVVGGYGVGGAIGVTVGGTLADRWGRRPTALLALGSASVLMLALGLATRPGTIIAAAAALGLATEMARPPLGAMIADLVPPADRMRAFSMYYWAINLGFSAAAILAGFAAHAGYLLLFAVDAGTTAVAAVLVAVKVRETRPAVAADPGGTGSMAVVFRDRVFLGFVACNLLFALIMLQHLAMLPISMQQDGLSTSTYGLVIALNGILIVSGQLFLTRLLRDRRPALPLALSAVVIGLGFGLTTFAHTPLWYAATVVIWTVGEMLNAPSSAALLSELSPVHLRGRYQGVYSLSWQVAAFAAPVLGGLVQQTAGGAALWLGCLALGLVAGGWNLASAKSRERRATELRIASQSGSLEPEASKV